MGELHCTMENGACAITRYKVKYDMFVHGQTNYCLFFDKKEYQIRTNCHMDTQSVIHSVFEKKFGQDFWSGAVVPDWT